MWLSKKYFVNIVYSKFHLLRELDRNISLRANKNIVEGEIKTLSKKLRLRTLRHFFWL